MTDDLVKRLRCYADLNDAVFHPWVYGEAADRIEKLEAGEEEWNRICNSYAARIDKLEAALNRVLAQCSWYNAAAYDDVEAIIRKALEGTDA
jgi:hypothetical protein